MSERDKVFYLQIFVAVLAFLLCLTAFLAGSGIHDLQLRIATLEQQRSTK
jgi:hypothetical protein